MIQLSKTGKIDDVIKAINELPEFTDVIDADCVTQAKLYASGRVEAMREKSNAVHLNLTVNYNAHFNSHQTEVQVVGRKL